MKNSLKEKLLSGKKPVGMFVGSGGDAQLQLTAEIHGNAQFALASIFTIGGKLVGGIELTH